MPIASSITGEERTLIATRDTKDEWALRTVFNQCSGSEMRPVIAQYVCSPISTRESRKSVLRMRSYSC